MKIKITVNGEEREVEENTTITDLLVLENVKMPDMVSVEYNGEMLDREKFDTTQLKENDEIEFLYFMGGGNVGI